MARALSQIMAELNSVYNPQRDLYNTQLQSIDPQMQAEEQGLQAAKADSFGEIQTMANRRGLNFSGIPLQEQAKYTGQSFLPAVANMKAKFAQQKFNLQDAIAKIFQDQQRDAYSIYDQEVQRDQQAEAARAARAAASSAAPSFGAFGGGSKAPVAAPAAGAGYQAPPELQQLYNRMFMKPGGGTWDDGALVNDYNATLKGAKAGIARDRQKLELYHMSRPDLFGRSIPGVVLANNPTF